MPRRLGLNRLALFTSSRIFVRFRSGDTVICGATSVGVRTQ
jgi:hypothetical protein